MCKRIQRLLISLTMLMSFVFAQQDVTFTLNTNGNLDYDSSLDIFGFQFSHNGCVTSASGGDAAASGFTVQASGSTVLAFSFSGGYVPAGTGTLVQLGGDVTVDCLSDFVVSAQVEHHSHQHLLVIQTVPVVHLIVLEFVMELLQKIALAYAVVMQ